MKSSVYLNFSRNSKVGLFSGLINFAVWQQDQGTRFVLSLCSALLSVVAFPLRLTLFIATIWLPYSRHHIFQHSRHHIKNSNDADRKGKFLMFLSHKLQDLSKSPQTREGRVKDFGKVMYTLLYLNWITHKNLLYTTWNSAQCYVTTWMRGVWGRMGTCICMAESLHCSPETITKLLISCTPI